MPSSLENKFLLYWNGCRGPKLTAEAMLITGRKWRVDFVRPESRLVIELEGGQWNGGRHTRGKGFEADCDKYLALTLAGYRVVRLVGKQITVPIVESLIKLIESLPKMKPTKPKPLTWYAFRDALNRRNLPPELYTKNFDTDLVAVQVVPVKRKEKK